MTKPRAPRTFAEATALVAGLLGYRLAGSTVGRAERTIYEWANPDSGTCPSIAQARDLDAAFALAGGTGAPFRDAYEFQLDLAVDRQDACRRALGDDIAAVAAEAGQAVAAALALLKSGASPLEALRASAEAVQAGAALEQLQRRLASFLPTGAGPVAGIEGGPHD